jgi:predicted O-methyltransferase YrrM
MTVQPGLPRYARAADYPRLVWAAVEATRRAGFDKACTPEAGGLLQGLAAERSGLRVLEIGTGCGVGSAWLLSGMDQSSRLVTVEVDRALAAVAERVLRADARARVLAGDWRLVKALRPFDLIFVDVHAAKEDPLPVLELMAPGAVCVFDDMTPGHDAAGDPVRLLWSVVAEVEVEEPALTASECALVIRAARD